MVSLRNSENLGSSVHRALQVLLSFQSRPEQGIVDLAGNLGLPQSTVHRIVTTLETAGFLARDVITARYRLGNQLVALGAAMLVQSDLRLRVLPAMQWLADATGLNANFSVPHGDRIMCLARVDGPELTRGYVVPGQITPLHCTGVGKALLAFLPHDGQSELLAHLPLRAYTPRTITDRSALQDHLDLVREQRHSVDDEEYVLGTRCVAVPIWGPDGGIVGALSVSGPAERINPADTSSIVQSLNETRSRISLQLGVPGA